jgi:WD40 repeat protein
VKKISNNRLYRQFLYILPLLTIIGSVYGMKRLLEEPTETTSSMTEEKPPRFEKWQNIWIKTSDDKIIAMPEWQVDQVKVLQLLLINQKGTNSKDNPIDASNLRKNNGTIVNTSSNTLNLIKTALEASKNPQDLSIFLTSLHYSPQEEGQKNYNSLINTAFDLEANALSAALASAILPSDMQKKIGFNLLTPIVGYFIDSLAHKFLSESKESENAPVNTRIKISPNGRYALSNDRYDDEEYVLWNLNTQQIINSLAYDIDSVNFSSTGAYIIHQRTIDDSYFTYNIFSNKFFDISIHKSDCITFSPDDTYCLFNNINNPGIINVISNNNTPDWVALPPLTNGHTAQINTIKFSPDGNYIVSGSNDDFPNNLILWDGKTFQKITSFSYEGPWTTHIYPVIQADFTPDSRYIISKDTQENSIVWDVASKEPIAKLDVHNRVLWKAANPTPTIINPKISQFTYNPYSLHKYTKLTGEGRTAYILGALRINMLFKHSILPINANSINELEAKPNNIVGRKYSSAPPFELKNMISIPNNNYQLLSAVESYDSQYLIFSLHPKYLTLIFADTGKIINIPVQPFNSVQFSPQNDYIIATHPHNVADRMFSLWTIADLRMMRDVADTSITLSQSRFLYRLYLAKHNDVKVIIDQNDPDYAVYVSLPTTIKYLVDKFLPFTLTSDIVQEALKEFRK